MPGLMRMMKINDDVQFTTINRKPELWLCHATMDVPGVTRYYFRESRPSRGRQLRVDWYADEPYVFQLQHAFVDTEDFNEHLRDQESDFVIRALLKNLDPASEAVYRHVGDPEHVHYHRIDLVSGGATEPSEGDLTCWTLTQVDTPNSILTVDQSGGMTRIYWGYGVPVQCFEDL